MANDIKLYSFSVVHPLFIVFVLFCTTVPQAKDTLGVGEHLGTDDYLASANRLFRWNFAQGQGRSYLGIHYLLYDDQTTKVNFVPVWVAVPNFILIFTFLVMNPDGRLVIHDSSGSLSEVNVDQPEMVTNTTATLLDNGNLVLRAGSRTFWQSFDYPGNTWLPGMKVGLFNLDTEQAKQLYLNSWTAEDNPSPGVFTLGVDPTNKKEQVNTKEPVIMRRGAPYWRKRIWNQGNPNIITVEIITS